MKKSSVILLAVSGTLLAFLSGCASREQERELRSEIRAERPADTAEEVMDRASTAFSNAPGLTPEQKVKLGAIYSRVYTDAMSIRREMGQAKSLLFSKLASVNYKEKEIVSLKNRIVTLDLRRLDVMFKALKDVQEVVGHGKDAEKIYKHFEDYEIPQRRLDNYAR